MEVGDISSWGWQLGWPGKKGRGDLSEALSARESEKRRLSLSLSFPLSPAFFPASCVELCHARSLFTCAQEKKIIAPLLLLLAPPSSSLFSRSHCFLPWRGEGGKKRFSFVLAQKSCKSAS